MSRYFLTSVGDLAADRLGDLLFERGDFGGAEGAWRTVVQDYPDTQLSPAKLQVKRCVALSRMGRREELEALAGMVAEQYADQKVTIGGEEVEAGGFVKGLLAALPAKGAAATEREVAEVEPELAGDDAVWQIRVIPAGTLEKMDEMIRSRGWGYMGLQFSGTIPGAAVDGKRLYVNWLGVVYAADLETGKMLWRTGKFTDVPQQAINFVQYGVDPTHFSVVAGGGKVYAMMQDAQNGNTGAMQLHCLDGETGKSLWWKADKFGVTAMSVPFVSGNTGYCLGMSGDALNLIVFNMETGVPEWRVLLGKLQATRELSADDVGAAGADDGGDDGDVVRGDEQWGGAGGEHGAAAGGVGVQA